MVCIFTTSLTLLPPYPFVENDVFTIPSSPGRIGRLLAAEVQPQPDSSLIIFKGTPPEFLMMNL
ncbi:MAG TPA: hypothetical protein DCR95_05905 [Desulfobacter sp.]|nr:hypothetical protein [Desulfobacter sp.]